MHARVNTSAGDACRVTMDASLLRWGLVDVFRETPAGPSSHGPGGGLGPGGARVARARAPHRGVRRGHGTRSRRRPPLARGARGERGGGVARVVTPGARAGASS